MDFAFDLSTAKISYYCLLAFLFAFAMTWAIRRHAILDIPNERSSHKTPTPRGGGIAIVFTFCTFILWLTWQGLIDLHLMYALIGGGFTIAAVGYYDDIHSLSARWRILLHGLAAYWALYWLDGFPIFQLGNTIISLNWIGSLLALIGIVWCINFYNFMDGIDGLAGSEGIFVSLASGAALWLVSTYHLAAVMWILAAAIAGFTVWNWQPAKIFLGDVGSGFLGYVFAVLGIFTIKNTALPITFWWIILAVFICDATFTLLHRVCQGKRWYEAHREHTYQYFVLSGMQHKHVTLSITLINCCILLPIAFTTLYWPIQSYWLMLGATLLLSFIWAMRFGLMKLNQQV